MALAFGIASQDRNKPSPRPSPTRRRENRRRWGWSAVSDERCVRWCPTAEAPQGSTPSFLDRLGFAYRKTGGSPGFEGTMEGGGQVVRSETGESFFPGDPRTRCLGSFGKRRTPARFTDASASNPRPGIATQRQSTDRALRGRKEGDRPQQGWFRSPREA